MATTLLFSCILLSRLLFSFAYVMSDGVTGKLPSLGWNSWNAFNCEITEERFLTAANEFIDCGLKDAGYEYVNSKSCSNHKPPVLLTEIVDDCWMMKDGRDDDGHLIPNVTRFPDGIKGLADKIHDMGLKLGIYSCAGTETCAGYPASLEHEETDASDFASWGIDYLKYDNCNIPDDWKDEYPFCAPETKFMNVSSNGTCSRADNPQMAPDNYDWSTSNTATRYRRMRDALASQDRTILFAMCVWGTGGVYDWGNDTAISWRMSDDIFNNWESVLRITNINSFRLHHSNFWGHNDADMLEVGNGALTHAESRSHFALWAAMKSPLLIGADISELNDDDLTVLKNKHLLAFNQDDVFGAPAMPYKWGENPDWTFNASWPAQYWSGESQAGTLVLLFNPAEDERVMTADPSEIPSLKGEFYRAVDVWSGEEVLGCSGGRSISVRAHDTAGLLFTGECDPSPVDDEDGDGDEDQGENELSQLADVSRWFHHKG